MIRGVVLSHTEMGTHGFCTNVGVRDGSNWVQWRLHAVGNRSLWYSDMNYTIECMKRDWQPGHWVDLPHCIPVASADRRVTHPEDVIIAPKEIQLYSTTATLTEFRAIAETMAFDSVATLFPEAVAASGKWYVPDGVSVQRSVGYVRATNCVIYEDWGKKRLRFTDSSGLEYDGPFKGVALLNTIANGHLWTGNLLIRLALAGPFTSESWAHSEHPRRCCGMVSHILE